MAQLPPRPLEWLARVGGLLLCVWFSVACREPAATNGGADSGGASPVGISAAQALALTGGANATTPGTAGAQAAPRVDLDARLYPPDQPLQHLAFTQSRLAQLGADELIVRRLPDLRVVARIAAPGARNIVAGVGGDFIAAGSEHVYRLADQDVRAELLAPVPRLGPTTILPAADSSDHFWLSYAGIPALPEFDLQETVITPYVSVLGWTALSEFDGRAITAPGDGSFVYTTPHGVRRRDAAGRSQDIVVPGPARQVWRLLPVAGQDGLWVATPEQLQLLPYPGRRSPGTGGDGSALAPSQRIELPAHTLALTSLGGDIAVLAVESFEAERARLRVEVYTPGSAEPRSLRLDDTAPAPAGAGAAQFAPELALAPGRPWLAVSGFGLAIFNWRTGARIFPLESVAAPAGSQKLAPGSH